MDTCFKISETVQFSLLPIARFLADLMIRLPTAAATLLWLVFQILLKVSHVDEQDKHEIFSWIIISNKYLEILVKKKKHMRFFTNS